MYPGQGIQSPGHGSRRAFRLRGCPRRCGSAPTPTPARSSASPSCSPWYVTTRPSSLRAGVTVFRHPKGRAVPDAVHARWPWPRWPIGHHRAPPRGRHHCGPAPSTRDTPWASTRLWPRCARHLRPRSPCSGHRVLRAAPPCTHLVERDAAGSLELPPWARCAPTMFGLGDAEVRGLRGRRSPKRTGEFLEIVNFNVAGPAVLRWPARSPA